MKKRCEWALKDELSKQYHDNEWGVPVHDDRLLFEFLILEGVQAGLSWSTVLKKREHYRKVYDNFDIEKVALYDEKKIEKLLADPGIIRNKLKVNASITNAQHFIRVCQEFGSFDNYIWQFVNGKTVVNSWKTLKEIPVSTKQSDSMSFDLKKRGFKFIGTIICYSFMQAVGMVNDHTVDCYRYPVM